MAVPSESRIVVEVVGPGFDASDILRSDVQPHERIEALVDLGGEDDSPKVHRYQRTYVVDHAEYGRSVTKRLAKIGARLRNPSHPEVALEAFDAAQDQLRAAAITFLGQTRQTLLLDHRDSYEPILEEKAIRFIRGIASVFGGLKRHGIQMGAAGFSASYLAGGRLVYWDFFPADEADAVALSGALPG